jgi:hypothetical protein
LMALTSSPLVQAMVSIGMQHKLTTCHAGRRWQKPN